MKFTHIYVENRILHHPRTRAILARFPQSQVILIDHYKDVFNRRGQDPLLQHDHQNLILAAAKDHNVYPGAPVCQNFGNAHFYYTSSAMNCVYDCEYCYLKGMYPSGNLVVFVDLERIMEEVEGLLAQFPVYLCVSYDTDLLAMEEVLHYAGAWAAFAAEHEGLTIEIRTKCARRDIYHAGADELSGTGDRAGKTSDHSEDLHAAALEQKTGEEPSDGEPAREGEKVSSGFSGLSSDARRRVIFAYTISPDEIITRYEHGTPPLQSRLAAAAEGLRQGFSVRLCFDPMIYVPGWREIYHAMLQQTAKAVPLEKVRDFSIGSFRISDTYLKNMRRILPFSPVVQYPFALDHGYYHYPAAVADEMETVLEQELLALAPGARIFRDSE